LELTGDVGVCFGYKCVQNLQFVKDQDKSNNKIDICLGTSCFIGKPYDQRQ